MSLTLYYFAECPYCQKVLRFMKEHKIELEMKNTREGTWQEELIRIGGKSQVPCLVIDGAPLYESEDIIQWLATNEAGGAKRD
ncbi:MAG: glutaredoxin [Chlamydiales bacterium]|jgi:glutathione S-transferase|nr:glutaredoxin [Chlamydiales bacterium]